MRRVSGYRKYPTKIEGSPILAGMPNGHSSFRDTYEKGRSHAAYGNGGAGSLLAPRGAGGLSE